MKAMIFAAGLGTRLKAITANKPKALVEVGNKPLIHHAIKKITNAGANEIVVNVHHFAPKVRQYIEQYEKDVPITISDETEQLLDTGGGLKKAASLLSGNEPIIAYNVDILSDIDLQQVVDYHKNNNALATLVVRNRETGRYLRFNDNHQLVGWINTATKEEKIARQESGHITQLAFSGIQVLSPDILNYFPEKEQFSVIDWYLSLAKTEKIIAFIDQSNLWMDVGKPNQLEKANRMFAEGYDLRVS